MRSLDFTSCSLGNKCGNLDCSRRLTRGEQEWLDNNPNRHTQADFDAVSGSGCFITIEERIKEYDVERN